MNTVHESRKLFRLHETGAKFQSCHSAMFPSVFNSLSVVNSFCTLMKSERCKTNLHMLYTVTVYSSNVPTN